MHVDAFLYDDEMVDALCEEGKLSHSYCLQCGSVNTRPLSKYQHHKIRHPRCVYNKLDWSLYTCLTQLYGGIDMCNLLHISISTCVLWSGWNH